MSDQTVSATPVKAVGMRIRVESELRDAFVEACRQDDRPAAQVIRAFMRDYLRKHQAKTATAPTLDKPSPRASLKSRSIQIQR